MALWKQITRLAKDPAPDHIFELSEAGIAYARNGETGFQAFEPGVLAVSPVADNLLRPDAVASALARIAPPNGSKRRPAAVILPDYAARVSLLDFDSFPSSPEEQLPLVRFRVKKTIPFDIESAAVSYWAQPASTKSGVKKVEVVAVTVAMEILARYEAVFRNANLHPGEVTTSGLAALNLYGAGGVAVIAKLTGNILTVMAVDEGQLKLFRCLTIEQGSDEEILAVLNPTFAYIEDELGRKHDKLLLCGFARPLEGLNLEMEPLRSRLGTPNPFNAGLLGYLEAAD
jgi:type IV pilus assembly protein PilM